MLKKWHKLCCFDNFSISYYPRWYLLALDLKTLEDKWIQLYVFSIVFPWSFINFIDQLQFGAEMMETHLRKVLLCFSRRLYYYIIIILVPHINRKLYLVTSLSDCFWKYIDLGMYIVYKLVRGDLLWLLSLDSLVLSLSSLFFVLVRGCVQVPCVNEVSTPSFPRKLLRVWSDFLLL